ncbi:spermidine synthase [Verrucomicrobiota bacterium]
MLGASGFAFVPLLATSPDLHANLWFPLAEKMEISAGLPFETTYPLIISLVFFLFPSVVIGMSFPIVLAAWQARAQSVGRSTGGVYAVGTFGSVIGGLAAGFLLIPWLGVQRGMTLTGAVIALVGVAMLAFRRGYWKIVSGVSAVATVVIILLVPGDLFERYLVARLKSHYKAIEVLHIKEGITTTATIHTQNQTMWTVPLSADKLVQRSVPTEGPTRHIAVSGLHVASDEPGQSAWQKFHGHSAMLLHGNAKRAVCVGYGSGESLACMARHQPEVLECVEISPEAVEASLKFFPHINLGTEQDKRARIIIADGRNYLHLTDERYDVIMSDPINPTTGENGSLYSLEFFQSAREHLEPGGLFLFWLPLHLPRNVLESILATAMEAYPYITVWTVPIAGGTFVQVVCSAEPQKYWPLGIDRKILANPRVRSDLERIGIPDSAALLAHYRGDERDIRQILQSPVVNTDDRPLVEFSTQRAMFKVTAPFILELLGCARENSLLDHIHWQGASAQQRDAWLARQNAFRKRIIP